MGSLILQIKYGGLGDHLFYSHIPRLAKAVGTHDRVFISNLSEFRHPDYKKYVWELNPYVDGFVDEPGVSCDTQPVDLGRENLLDTVMLSCGIDDGQRFHEPEVHFSCAWKPEFETASVFDPNFVSYVGDFTSWDLQWHLWQRRIRFDVQLATRVTNKQVFNARRSYRPSSFEDFCSVIVSCRELYCVTSGTATLAAALGKPVTAFYGSGQRPLFHHSRLHRYRKIEPFQPVALLRDLLSRASA